MEKVLTEQREIFQDNFLAEVTQQDLTKMKYLESVVKEALRLYPSVPILARTIEKDSIIDGQFVPKGTSATIFVYLLHRNPLVWEKPDEFIPERFLDSDSRFVELFFGFVKRRDFSIIEYKITYRIRSTQVGPSKKTIYHSFQFSLN